MDLLILYGKFMGYFFYWLFSKFFLLDIIYRTLGNMAIVLNIIWYLTLIVIMNPLPETIYIKSYSPPWDSIVKTMAFMQENWFNWLLPNVVFYGLLFITSGTVLMDIFNTHISFNMAFNVKNVLVYFIGQILFSITMIYRGHLYKLLSTSTRRKRMFMNKF